MSEVPLSTMTAFVVRATLLTICGSIPSATAAQMYDVLIRGGTVYDGSERSKPRVTDVAIRGDRVVLVGKAPAKARARKLINAKGKIVSPGFIDPHSHAAEGLQHPSASAGLPALYQGITTVMINPDGSGPAELAPQLRKIAGLKPGVNVISMIGHGAIREAVMGREDRKADAKDIAKMQALVETAFQQGAFGISAGLHYAPAKFSDTREQIEITKPASKYPFSFYTSHIRDESDYNIGVLGAIQEVISVAREANVTGVVTHIKMLGPRTWGMADDAIKLIEAARARGARVYADQYPYTAGSSSLQAALVPGWAQAGEAEDIAKRMRDPAQREKMRAEMAENLERRAGANSIMIIDYPPNRSIEGKRLDEIAKGQGKDAVETAMDLLAGGSARINTFVMNEDDIETFMKRPWVMTSTDGGMPVFGQGIYHPRSYGAFPRKIRNYVIDKPVISMQQAIHSSTGLTAKVFGIRERGVLKAGAFADVLVFNPKTIRDLATYEKPHAYSVGMEYVFVNGKPAIENGRATMGRNGRMLSRRH